LNAQRRLYKLFQIVERSKRLVVRILPERGSFKGKGKSREKKVIMIGGFGFQMLLSLSAMHIM
jgi:hypothetical protein